MDFKFIDYAKITKPTDEQLSQWKDNMAAMPIRHGGLHVVMEATHAGVINRNGRFYIPSRMAEGVGTFRVAEKPTKIMKHHDLDTDPVGIISGARFVPTIPDDLRDNPDVHALMSSSASIQSQLSSFRNLLRAGIINRDGWRGLGHIELAGYILDKETMEQVQDGRFDAVSTNFRSPGEAYCDICGQNWGAVDFDELCDHFGQETATLEDDDFQYPVMAIPGTHKYLETSLVALEGDELATIHITDKANSNNNKTYFLPNSFDWEAEDHSNSTIEWKDFKEDIVMAAKNKATVLSDAEKKVSETIKKLRPDMADEQLIELSKKISAMYDANGFLPSQEAAELDEDTAILYTIENIETADLQMDDAKIQEIENLYQEEFIKMAEENLITAEELEDAKLSTAKRKSLSKSTFCGPNRSFPVPDCAHVTAARRLIGRYKGPGDKSAILACVNRKAKALGCNGSKDNQDLQPDNIDINLLPCNADQLKNICDNDLRSIYMSVEIELVRRGHKMAYECKECALHKTEVDKARQEVVDSLTKIAELNNIIKVLRSELNILGSEYVQQVDNYVELGIQLHKAQVEKFALIGVLSKKYDNIDDAYDAIGSEDIKKLETTFADFDIMKIVDKLNDGMARTPQGIVNDPSINIDNDNLQNGRLSEIALTALGNIKDAITAGDMSIANHSFKLMKEAELFPTSLKFEDIVAEVRKAAND
jgi:hypothetical protein